MLKIIKAETSLGSSNKGTELAPNFLLKNGLTSALNYNKIEFEILRLKHPPMKDSTSRRLNLSLVKNHDFLTAFNRSIYSLAVENKNPGDKVLMLGGDHSASIGSMFATKNSSPDAMLLYIDAHPDSNTPSSSPSGNMHGMSLATVLGDSLYSDYNLPKYRYKDAILLGAKDIDKYESEYIKEKGIKMFTVDDIISEGVGNIMREILSLIGNRPLHISLDIDVIDQNEAPGTGVPNRGGLTYREIKYITEKLLATNIRSIDLVEVNPKKDVKQKTTDLGTELILNLLGGKWSPYEKYLSKHDA